MPDAPAPACRHPAALSLSQFRRDSFPAVTQHGPRLVTRDAFEGFEEVVKREAIGEVVKKRFHRQPRGAKDWCASENGRIRHHQTCGGGFDFSNRAHLSNDKRDGGGFQPRRLADDARHAAVCTVAQIDFLVSWNFKHLVNVSRETAFNGVNLLRGYRAVRIVNPLELIYGNESEEI